MKCFKRYDQEKNQKIFTFYPPLSVNFFSVLGIKDYFSGISNGFDYWGTLIIFIGTLPGTLHIQNKG